MSSWWSRNWKWFVPVLCVAGVVAAAVPIVIIYVFVTFFFNMMKTSGGYEEALAAARADPAVVQALGSPIKDGLMPQGEVSTTRSDLEIPISGPKGKGTLYVSATKSLGEWQFTGLVVEVRQTGERIDLLARGTP